MALFELYWGDAGQRMKRIINFGYKHWRQVELMKYYILHLSGGMWEQQQAYSTHLSSEQRLYQFPRIWSYTLFFRHF